MSTKLYNTILQGIHICCALALAMLLLVSFPATTFAHASVISATPGINSTVSQPPTQVTVKTAQNMNPDSKMSYLTVYSPKGEIVSENNSAVSMQDQREMSVAIKADGNGTYVVRWVTMSAEDNEADEGAFTFTVNPNSKGTSSGNSSSTNDSQSTDNNTDTAGTGHGNSHNGTQESTPANNSNAGSGVAPWVPIATGAAALLIGLGAGVGLGRRSASTSTMSTMRHALSQEEHDKRS